MSFLAEALIVRGRKSAESLRGKLAASFEKISYARVRVESRSKDDNFDRVDDLRSRNGVALVRSYCTMPDDRFQRWVDASSAAGAVEPFMIPLVQGLGRFDCHLINEDARSAALNQEQSSSLHEGTRLTDRLTLSYFWVLAAYELVRTLDRRWRTGATTLPDESGNRVAALKRRMERLRIPLAKMETTRRFPTDNAIAYPTISRDFGLAWHVAQDTYISRRELSDQLLDFLADLKKRQTQKKT